MLAVLRRTYCPLFLFRQVEWNGTVMWAATTTPTYLDQDVVYERWCCIHLSCTKGATEVTIKGMERD